MAEHASQDYSNHENMWDAQNTKAYTTQESFHKFRTEYAGFFPGRHAKYFAALIRIRTQKEDPYIHMT
jgi:hypothetical protein